MPRQVFLIRHAESMGNAGMRTTTPAGNNLTDKGRKQAGELAASINEIPDLIVWSSYSRTRETALPLVQKYPEVRTEEWPDIQEFTYLNPNKCFNTTPEDRKPMVTAYWETMDPDYNDGEGAESFAEMIQRVKTMLRRVKERPEDTIYIFTHGQFMETVKIVLSHPDENSANLMRIFNERNRGKLVANCEIMRII